MLPEALDPEDKTDPQIRVPGERFPVPWGLLVVLVLYGLGLLAYVWAIYWNSPEYQAAEHWARTVYLLGDDGGRSATREKLVEAYEHLVEAGRLKPEISTFHDEAESLNWRFEERGWKVPQELRRLANANAEVHQRIQQRNEPILIVGLRDRGWAPAQLLEGPARVAKWSPVGAVLIIALWAYGRFSAKRVREEERIVEMQELKRDVEDLGSFRDRSRPANRRVR